MNKENAKDYLPLVQALAEGKTIQHCKVSGEASSDYWQDCIAPTFGDKASRYRIKPEQKKQYYRVSLMLDEYGNFFVSTIDNSSNEDESNYESEKGYRDGIHFVRWLTDRIEYTLPEGDA